VNPLIRIDSVAVPLDESNIDTDQLAPGRFLMRPVFSGLLLHDRRFDLNGIPRSDCILNDTRYSGAEILVARRNFGVGSSREFAARALPAAGFRCVVAVSFGDIFYTNCLQIGVLPVALTDDEVGVLIQRATQRPEARIVVDLATQTLACDDRRYSFEINHIRKTCLLEGLDDIALTKRYTNAIRSFEDTYLQSSPWLTSRISP